jgi:hypothetical protein
LGHEGLQHLQVIILHLEIKEVGLERIKMLATASLEPGSLER